MGGILIMEVLFLKSTDDRRKLTKKYTTIKKMKNVDFKDTVSIISPTLIVTMFDKFDTCNYVFIETLNRYYSIKDVKILSSTLLQIDCEVDVLASYSSEIKNLTTLIVRQENKFEPYVVDSHLPVRVNRKVQYLKFSSSPFTNGKTLGSSNYCFALTVNGGV